MVDVSEKPKVFVSYSRDDLLFAEQLVLALQERGFEPLLDRHDIDAAEDWKKRLYELIFHSDTVAFVLSEHSAASPICAWEVETAEQLGKRMIPVVHESVKGVTPPSQLSDLNYIYFYSEPTMPGSGFYDGVMKLDGALRVDLAWVREATRLAERASDWIASGRDQDGLLRGSTLKAAQDWLARTPTDTEVLPDTLNFLIASADDEKAAAEKKAKTQKALRGAKSTHMKIIASAALLVIAVGVLASWIVVEEITWNLIRIWGLDKMGLYDGPEMIEIRPGPGIYPDKFIMGDNDSDVKDEQPAHPVQFSKPFAIGRYEITFDEYNDYIIYKGLEQPDNEGWEGGNLPVINVSWNEVQGYINWLNEITGKHFRLPTESEWEHVARAGESTQYWWGDDARKDGKAWANCKECGSQWDDEQPVPVGSFEANDFRLYDTAGNVWEWVEDCWHESYSGENRPDDGSAWLEVDDDYCDRRVIRGGSWFNYPVNLRSAHRAWFYPSGADSIIGFRLAQDLD